MKKSAYLYVLIPVVLLSCSSSKTYFTAAIRSDVEGSHQRLEKIQFYADRDIVLYREMELGEAKVTSGVVKIENGHYVNIITLKKNTPGVCTVVRNNAIGVSFEKGSSSTLSFGKTKYAKPDDPYRILANDWVNNCGVVMYDGKQYCIQPEGSEASIMIKTKVHKKSVQEEREMKGRKVASNN
ncbi:MAG TPA: hypothetical protein VMH01_16160 [Puia sp.]|nr:hypothetical protein [Puia sp.]